MYVYPGCRYFPLLGKVNEDGSTPLTYIFRLLHTKTVRPAVVKVILELVENLLTMSDEPIGEGHGQGQAEEDAVPAGQIALDDTGMVNFNCMNNSRV